MLSIHIWMIVNIKSKDSDPLIGTPFGLFQRSRAQGGNFSLVSLNTHSLPPSTTSPPLSLSLIELQGKLKQMLLFFFHSQATFILTNIYPNRYILIETNGS